MRKIVLRRIDYRRDLELLFKHMMDIDMQCLLSEQFEVNTIARFERWLNMKFDTGVYHDFFMIDTQDGKTVGFTFSYDYSASNGHCKYTLCIFDEYQNFGLGVYSAVKMLQYMFKVYPLRQVFISVYDYNKASLSVNKRGGFEEVGVYPEYRYFDGKYHDLHIMRITRDKFYEELNSKFNSLKI